VRPIPPGCVTCPVTAPDANAAWLEIIMAATDLVAWTQLIGFTDHPDVATCEIATFRYRVLPVGAHITRAARRIRLRIDAREEGDECHNDGAANASARGRPRGKQPKRSPRQEAHLVELYRAGAHTIGELEELFPVSRSTIYRAVQRASTLKPARAHRE